jgi:hypothetical protein
MKTLNLIISCFLFSSVLSQEIIEKAVKTKVNEVTVFIEGAQITRKKNIELNRGITLIKFEDLSPFIDPKSIQVKAHGNITVLAVNHQQNYLDNLEKSKVLEELESKLEELGKKINLERTYLSIIHEELQFLKDNRTIGGKDQAISVVNLKEASVFYGDKLTSLKLKEIERNKTIEDLTEEKNKIQKQINTLSGKKEYPNGEVLVKVKSGILTKADFELSYLVSNAGWFPSYDIRAKNISEPVELIYKANMHQDTKIDWKNVKLRFSSSDPNVTGVAPELKTYYLNYHSAPPTYGKTSNQVSGRVFDLSTREPLPGVNVLVKGTTIGTVTDINGNYNLTLPNNAGALQFSFVGYVSQELPISSPTINVGLNEDLTALDEVVVIGYGSMKKSNITGTVSQALEGRVAGVEAEKNIRVRGTSSLAIPAVQVEHQTTVEFEIKTPYSINSDNKNYVIDMESYSLPAYYEYYCVPKIDKDAFLIANIIDWEKYNLLEGEASIFFEDTYVGKSLLDVRFVSDTLSISLGRDKNVVVNRDKQKDFTTKQFIGNKKEETKAYLISVRNNKNQKIIMVVMDQVPVSTLEEITVEIQKISGAKHKEETGEIMWKFNLNPSDKKEFELKYSVKYPKHKNLFIE